MKKSFVTILALATALVACQKNETPLADQSRKAVKFSVQNLGTYEFKSATVALGEDGSSSVGIFAPDLGANNVEATVSGNALTPASAIYWKIGQTTDTKFVARYPYHGSATTTGAYAIPADQHDYEYVFSYHSNVMYAVTDANPDPGTVEFAFKHPFAKVIVNVTNNLGADAVASVVMKNVKLDATSLDITTDPATITLADSKSNVTACCTAANKYELVVMPQPATSEMDIVVTTVLNSVFTFRINLTNAYNFVPGKQSQVNVVLNPAEGGSGAGLTSVGAVSFSTPEAWTDGAATTVDAVGDPTINYYQIGGCVYSTADKDNKPTPWNKYYNMQYVAENTWQITLNYDLSMTEVAEAKGFKIRLGDTYWGMWTGENPTSYITDDTSDYALGNTYEHGNILLSNSSGNYTITFNSSTHIITTHRNGAKE